MECSFFFFKLRLQVTDRQFNLTSIPLKYTMEIGTNHGFVVITITSKF